MNQPSSVREDPHSVPQVLTSDRISLVLGNALPLGTETFRIGVGVLNDERADLLRMSQRHAKTHGPAVILQKERVPLYAEVGDQPLHLRSKVVEGVGVLRQRRCIALAEAGVVGRNQVISVGEQR